MRGSGRSGRVGIVAAALFVFVAVAPTVAAHAATYHGRWYGECPLSHSSMDDPIKYPAQPDASHTHDFYGNVATDAYSTPESLQTSATTCPDAQDHSAYWAPQASLNGTVIVPKDVSTSFGSGGFEHVDAFPAGAELISGNSHATQNQPQYVVYWDCGPHLNSPKKSRPYDCTPYAEQGSKGVRAVIGFPNCWSGTLVDGDDTSQFAFSVKRANGTEACPPAFPNQIVKLNLKIRFYVMNPLNEDGSMAMTLSSGPYYTIHADFMNGWDQERFQYLVDTCVNGHLKCGKYPPPGP